MLKSSRSSGLTLIEILLAIAASILVIGAVSVLVTRIFTLSREQFEQAQANQEATDQSRRISRAIESARNVSNEQTQWLVVGGPNSLQFYTNVDSDDETEIVRYFLEDDSNLKRGVTQLDSTNQPVGSEEVGIIARYIQNISVNDPLFTYNTNKQGTITSVTLEMAVDVNLDHYPRPILIKTDQIVPRQPLLSSQQQSNPIALIPGQGQVASALFALSPPLLFCPGSGTTLNAFTSMCTINDPGNPTTPDSSCLYVGTGGPSHAQVYRYSSTPTNSNAVWTKVDNLPTGSGVSAKALINFEDSIYVGTSGPGKVYKLTTSGWQEAMESNAVLDNGVNALAVNEGQLYAASEGSATEDAHVYAYTAPDTWVSLGVPGSRPGRTVQSVKSLLSYGRQLYASISYKFGLNNVYGGLYYLDDNNVWKVVQDPFEPNPDFNPNPNRELITAMASYIDAKMYIGYSAQAGVHSSFGSGNSQRASTDTTFAAGEGIKSLLANIFDQTLYASVDNGNKANAYMYNGGTDWLKVGDIDSETANQLFIYQGQLCVTTGTTQGKVFCKNNAASLAQTNWTTVGTNNGVIGDTTEAFGAVTGACTQVVIPGSDLVHFTYTWEGAGGQNLDIQLNDTIGHKAGFCYTTPASMTWGGDASTPPGTEVASVDLKHEYYQNGNVTVDAYAKWTDRLLLAGKFNNSPLAIPFLNIAQAVPNNGGGFSDSGEYTLKVEGLRGEVDTQGNPITEKTYTCTAEGEHPLCENIPTEYTKAGTLQYNQPNNTISFTPNNCQLILPPPPPPPDPSPLPSSTPTPTPPPEPTPVPTPTLNVTLD